jgi:ankyrin repeat protein
VDILEAFIAAGISIDYEDPDVLMNAALGNCVSIVEQILAYHRVHGVLHREHLDDALVAASRCGHVNVVRAFLNSGVDMTPIPHAAFSRALGLGHPQTARLLIDAKASLKKEIFSMLPLKAAVEGSCSEIVAELIEENDDVDNIHGSLCFASKPDIVKMLLDVRHPRSSMSLLSACSKLNPASVRMLLDAGAYPGYKSDFDPMKTTLSHACTEDTIEAKISIINMLFTGEVEQATSDDASRAVSLCSAAVEDACMEQVLDAVLHKYPYMLGIVNSYGRTPLCEAMIYAKFKKARWMVAAGADINKRNEKTASPLIFVLFFVGRQQYTETQTMLKQLIDAGVDLGACDSSGMTVFMAAASMVLSDAALAVLVRDMAGAVLRRGLGGTEMMNDVT